MHEAAWKLGETLTKLGKHGMSLLLIIDHTAQVAAHEVLDEVVLLPLIQAFIKFWLHGRDLISG